MSFVSFSINDHVGQVTVKLGKDGQVPVTRAIMTPSPPPWVAVSILLVEGVVSILLVEGVNPPC